MEKIFSVDDLANQFCTPETASSSMNHSSSEWAFQSFIQQSNDDVVPPIQPQTTSFHSKSPPNVPVDSDEYQTFLKNRLNLACAAVARTRGTTYAKSQESAAIADKGSQASSVSQLGPQVPKKGSGYDPAKEQRIDDAMPQGMKLPDTQKNSIVQGRSTTSGSSRDLSDDEEEAEGETDNKDPSNAKRVRRKISNRESARRSRKRKQAHLTDLETQAAHFQRENCTLLKTLSEISQKYNDEAVDNRVLKADIETLRAKVQMAEETVKRVTGLNPRLLAMSEMSAAVATSSFNGSPSKISVDASVPVQADATQHYYHQPASNNHMYAHDQRVQNNFESSYSLADNNPQNSSAKVRETAMMQRVASLEHLQKRIRGGNGNAGDPR